MTNNCETVKMMITKGSRRFMNIDHKITET